MKGSCFSREGATQPLQADKGSLQALLQPLAGPAQKKHCQLLWCWPSSSEESSLRVPLPPSAAFSVPSLCCPPPVFSWCLSCLSPPFLSGSWGGGSCIFQGKGGLTFSSSSFSIGFSMLSYFCCTSTRRQKLSPSFPGFLVPGRLPSVLKGSQFCFDVDGQLLGRGRAV